MTTTISLLLLEASLARVFFYPFLRRPIHRSKIAPAMGYGRDPVIIPSWRPRENDFTQMAESTTKFI